MKEGERKNSGAERGEWRSLMPSGKVTLSLVLLWLATTAWRPLVSGFYSDDWSLLTNSGVGPVHLSDYLWVHAPRPLYAVLSWSLNLLLHGTIRSWTVAASLIVLVTVFCLFVYLRFLFVQLGMQHSSWRGAFFGTVVWLFSPLSVVSMNWPSNTVTLTAFWLLVIGTVLAFRERPLTQLLGMFALFVSFLVYEAYLLVFPISVLAVGVGNNWNVKKYFRPMALYAGAFALSIAYKEIAKAAGFGFAVFKTYNPLWLKPFFDNVRGVAVLMREAFFPHAVLLYFFGVLFLLLVFTLSRTNLRRTLALLFAVIAGYCSSAALYAMVGYPLAATGVMSRTLVAPLLYLAIGLGGLFALARDGAERSAWHGKAKLLILYVTASCLLLVSVSANFARSKEWFAVWKQEKAMMRFVPVESIVSTLAQGPLPVVIVVWTPDDPYGTVFGASWELTGAVAYSYPQLETAIRRKELVFAPGRERVWKTEWNGGQIEQRWQSDPGTVVASHPSARAYCFSMGGKGSTALSSFTSGRQE